MDVFVIENKIDFWVKEMGYMIKFLILNRDSTSAISKI